MQMTRKHVENKPEVFHLPDKIRKIIAYIDIYLENFPYKYKHIKDEIARNSYEMLYCTYKANKTDNVYVKLDLLDDIYAKSQMLQFLLNFSYEKGIINKKRINKFGNQLGAINSMVTGWKKTSLNEKQKLERHYRNIYKMSPKDQMLNIVQNATMSIDEEDVENVEQPKQDIIENKEKDKKEEKKEVEIENVKNKELEEQYQNMDVKFPKPLF